MKKSLFLFLTLLLIWLPLSLQDTKAEQSDTVTDATYGDETTVTDAVYDFPLTFMAPFSLMSESDNYITFLYDGFSSSVTDRLILNLHAQITNNVIRLTPAQSNKAGSVFNKERVSLQDDRSFSTYFTFELSGGGGYGDGWADGFVFTVQTDDNTAATIGGSLGYYGIDPSLGIKFDTWQNSNHQDTSNNLIAVVKDGDIEHPLVVKDIDPAVLNFKSGTIHVWIDYNGPTGLLEVRLNNSAARPAAAELSYPLPEKLTSILDSDLVYVGFTAATGGAYQNHDIKTWYFTNKLDPIDTQNKTYKQAPTGYNITNVTLDDGTVELTITPTGGDDNKNVEVKMEGTNDAVITPSQANTGEEGKVTVIASSPSGETILTKIKVTGPGGITASKDITIPGRTAAPDADKIEANATDGTVSVSGVPEGATVTIYDHEGNKLAWATNVTGGKHTFSGLNMLTPAQKISLTFEAPPKVESTKTDVYPKVRSVLDPSKVVLNATTDKASVRDVPAGAVIRVYDSDTGGNQIGEGTNEDNSTAAIEVEIDSPGVDHKDKVYMTIQAQGELESVRVEIEALAQSSKLSADQVETDGTADEVTVLGVPAGATVVIYDTDRIEMGRKVNNAATDADVVFDELGLDFDMTILVTLIETEKLESDPVALAVTFTQSDAPKSEDIDANATKSIVTVNNVPANTEVAVYDADGNVLGSKINNEASAAAVSLTFDNPRLAPGQGLDITLKEPRKTVSAKTRVTAYYEKSAKLDAEKIIANATTSKVTVTGVKPGAEIIVYNAAGDAVLGSEVNNLASDANMIITVTPPLAEGDTIQVTITEQYHSESDPVSVIAKLQTDSLPEARIRADATSSTITFKDIPDGAEIIVYDDQNAQIASVTNNQGKAADLTADIDSPKLVHLQEIRVTIREPDKLVSDPTVTVAREQTAKPELQDVLDIDFAAGTVKMGNVPPGAMVIIYDQDGQVMGSGIYGGAVKGEIVISELALESAAVFLVTYTEPDKYESEKLTVDVSKATDDLINDAIKELEIGYQDEDTWESVTLPIFMVSVGKHNTSVSWTSGKPGVIEITDPQDNVIEALVHRQDQDESVILTALVTKNGQIKTRTFLVIVKAKDLSKTTEKNYREVKVIGGENAEVNEHVQINRVQLTNGSKQSKIDKVVFDEATAAQFVGDARTKKSVSSIYVDEVQGDEPDEFAVEVPEASMKLLYDNGNSLEVRTDYGGIMIENDELKNMVDNSLDLYFRLVPVKDPYEQQHINHGIRNEAQVQIVAAGKDVLPLGSSMKVETNYSGYTTKLILYFEKNGIEVPPTNVAEFLDSLRVYIEHSDGTKDVKVPTPVYDNGEPVGLSIEIDKFSTFTILQLREPDDDSSEYVLVNPGSGLDQIITAKIDADRQAIVLELDSENYLLDTEGFDVLVKGSAVAVREVSEEGRFVTIRLNDPLPPGYLVTLNYSPEYTNAGGKSYLHPFSGLLLRNPGYHAAYILGFEDGTFRPDKPVTRAEIAAILARNLDLPASAKYQGLFPDVSASHWAWSDIELLKGAGLLIGDTDGRFRPQDAITRAEMAMIAAKWLKADLNARLPQPFPDVADSHWAAPAIAAAYRAGIITGFDDGTFGTDALLTRAQAVTIMNRLLGRQPISGSATPSWPDVGVNHWAFREIEEASHGHYYLYDEDAGDQETWTEPVK